LQPYFTYWNSIIQLPEKESNDVLPTEIVQAGLYFLRKVPDIIYLYAAPSRQVLFANKSLPEYFGYTIEELNHYTSFNQLAAYLVHPDDLPQLAHFIERVYKSEIGELVSVEYRFKHKNGQYIWQYVREMVVERNINGQPIKVLGLQENIQSRKEEEANFYHTHQLYKTIVESQDDIICRFTPDLTLTFVNKSYANMWGYEPAEVVGMPLTNFLRPDQPQKVKDYLSGFSAASPFNKEIEYSITRQGILWFEWSTRAIFDKEGNIVAFQSVGRDITKQYQTELALRENEALLNESQKIANIGSWLYRIEDRQAKFSKGFFDVLKIEKEPQINAITQNIGLLFKMVNLSDCWQLKRRLIEAYRYQKECQHEFRLRLAEQGEIYVNIIIKHHTEEGITRWLFGTIQDITIHKNREAELLKAKSEAEEAALVKQRFLSTMSHEIRNPLNAVIGITRLLIQANQDKNLEENLNTLKFSADNLLAIINDVLDFNRIESGKIELESVPLNIKNLLERIKESHRYLATQKNLEIKLVTDADVPKLVLGDPIRLTQVINNLVGNAIKFTEKGCIRIELLLVNETMHNVRLKFSVHDTGIGIPPEKIMHIFESFTQADVTTTRKFGGSGLGLTISKKILELYNSSIQVESQPAKGSVFSFEITFPKHKEEKFVTRYRKTAIPEKIQPAIRSDAKILLVEDNAVNRLVATRFLNQWNLSPDVAENGKQALQKVLQNKYDVVLMDLLMPEMNGFEATQVIRSQLGTHYKKLPIIALTADAMPETRQKVAEFTMNGFLSKPFSPEQLYEVIIPHIKQENKIAGIQKLYSKIDERLSEEVEFQLEVSNLYIKLFEEYQILACKAIQEHHLNNFRFHTHKIKTAIQLLQLTELDELTQEIREYITHENPEIAYLQSYTAQLTEVCQNIKERLQQNIKQIQDSKA